MVRRSFERTRRGDVRVRLGAEERTLLRAVVADLRTRLEADPDDPRLDRLFPPGYDDEESDAEYRRLTRGELLDGRLGALRTLEQTAHRDRLDEAEANAWLGALNDARLVLGTELAVTEETFARAVDPRDPHSRELGLYAYLSWLQEQLVEALAL